MDWESRLGERREYGFEVLGFGRGCFSPQIVYFVLSCEIVMLIDKCKKFLIYHT
jgi:hypothetical protein